MKSANRVIHFARIAGQDTAKAKSQIESLCFGACKKVARATLGILKF